jgi:hypothetical protein
VAMQSKARKIWADSDWGLRVQIVFERIYLRAHAFEELG